MENHVFKKLFTAAWLALLFTFGQLAAAATNVSVTATPSNPTAPATVTLAVSGDSDGNPIMVTKVEYFNGTISMGVSVQSPFTLTLNNLAAGTYQISVKVTTTDPANPVLQSAPLAVTVGTAPSAATAYFIHTDQLNTPRAITDSSGNLVWQWDSDPFGKDAANEQPVGQPAFTFNQRFPGQQFDRETNLHYNYYRDYDPALGRYVESDPIGLGGGINTYGYVLGNPVSLSDQDGLAAGVRVCVNGYCPPLPPGYIDPVTGQPSAAVADEGRSRSRESSSEARSRVRQCPPEDDNKKCNATMSRAAAQAAAYAWAGIAENGKGANSIPWSNFNMPAGMSRSGKEWGDFMRQNYDRPYGYGTPDGNSVTEHPFGHPDQPGPAHHSCPHFHARNRAGVEQIFTYRAN